MLVLWLIVLPLSFFSVAAVGCRLLCLPRILYTLCIETFGHILVDVRCFFLVVCQTCHCFQQTRMHLCEDGDCGCRLDKLVLLLGALLVKCFELQLA